MRDPFGMEETWGQWWNRQKRDISDGFDEVMSSTAVEVLVDAAKATGWKLAKVVTLGQHEGANRASAKADKASGLTGWLQTAHTGIASVAGVAAIDRFIEDLLFFFELMKASPASTVT
jgi:hypothetical protein